MEEIIQNKHNIQKQPNTTELTQQNTSKMDKYIYVYIIRTLANRTPFIQFYYRG